MNTFIAFCLGGMTGIVFQFMAYYKEIKVGWDILHPEKTREDLEAEQLRKEKDERAQH